MKRSLGVLGLVVVLAAVGLGVWFVVRMGGPRNAIGRLLYDQRREGDLAVGDQAPDVALVALDGSTRVRLRDHVGERPLILIFGSYT